jgi:hypothetical protein
VIAIRHGVRHQRTIRRTSSTAITRLFETDQGGLSEARMAVHADQVAGPVLELYTEEPDDPPPRGSRTRWLVAGSLVCALLFVGVVNRERRADPKPPPPSVAPLNTPADHPVTLPGTALLVAGDGDHVYAVTSDPSEIVRIEAQSTKDPTFLAQTPISPRAFGFFIDVDTAYLWSLERTGDNLTDIVEYDPISLAEVGRHTLNMYIAQAVAVDNTLWLATSQGVYSYDWQSGKARRLLPGAATAITTDPLHQRVIVAQPQRGGTMMYSIDVETRHIATRTWVALSDLTMALVSDDLWIAGSASSNQPGLVHLPASWLSPTEQAPTPAGSSVTIWPGEQVVWLQNGAHLSCLSSTTGQTLTTTSDLIGPVVSGLGYAYVVSGGNLHILDLRSTTCRQG